MSDQETTNAQLPFNLASGKEPLYKGFEHYVENAGPAARYALATGNRPMYMCLVSDTYQLLDPAKGQGKFIAAWAAGLLMATAILQEFNREVGRINPEFPGEAKRARRHLEGLSDQAVEFNSDVRRLLHESQVEIRKAHKYSREAFDTVIDAYQADLSRSWGRLVTDIEAKERSLDDMMLKHKRPDGEKPPTV